MSVEINIYIDSVKNISKVECEKYLSKFGMKVEINQEVNFEIQEGFLPFKVQLDNPKEFMKGKDFISGFEFFKSPYSFKKDKNLGVFNRIKNLFSKENYIYNKQIDETLSKCSDLVTLSFGGSDSLELRMALTFSAYLVDNCNGIMFDPQNEGWYLDNISEVLYRDIQDYDSTLTAQNSSLHEFTELL